MKKPSVGHEGSMWRFLPAKDELPFISIDIDEHFDKSKSLSEQPWYDDLDDWIDNSEKPFYQKRETIVNMFTIPITAKYWGSKNRAIPNIDELINDYSTTEWYGTDEAMLTKEIWPLLKRKVIIKRHLILPN